MEWYDSNEQKKLILKCCQFQYMDKPSHLTFKLVATSCNLHEVATSSGHSSAADEAWFCPAQ